MGTQYFPPPTSASEIVEFSLVGVGAPVSPPSWAVSFDTAVIGAGGGGGGGRRSAVLVACAGGGGGGGGLQTNASFVIAELAASLGILVSQFQLEPNIGAGGNGGAITGANDTSGTGGASGGTSSLRARNTSNSINKTIVIASGGSPGPGGSTAAGAGGGPVTQYGLYPGCAGGTTALGNGNQGGISAVGPSGGGSGAGHPTGTAAPTVGGGSQNPSIATFGTIVAGAAAGAAAGTTVLPTGCAGVGGGGGNSDAGGNASNGGAGSRGGGGGGAGASYNTASFAGAGGKGGDGYVLIRWRAS
jgi:hypothetical protein